MSTRTVMLKRNWPGQFRRSIRKPSGKIVRTLVFSPGDPVELDAREFAAIQSDIGPALVEVEIEVREEDGRKRIRPVKGDETETAAVPASDPTPPPAPVERTNPQATTKS